MCVRLQNGTWGDSAATIALTILVSKWPATGWLFCLLLVLPIPAFCQWYLGPYCWKIIGFIMIAKMIDKLKLISTLLGWVCWKALRPFDVFFISVRAPLQTGDDGGQKRSQHEAVSGSAQWHIPVWRQALANRRPPDTGGFRGTSGANVPGTSKLRSVALATS